MNIVKLQDIKLTEKSLSFLYTNNERTKREIKETIPFTITIQDYLKKQEKNQINNLTLHLKQLEKEEMKNPRVSRRKEIFKIGAEINAKETKDTIAKINKAKSWFFEKINQIDKPLARFSKKQRQKIKSTKLEMKIEKSKQITQKY